MDPPRMVRNGLLGLLLLGALVVACSPESAAKPTTICTPGAYVFCRCQDREQGTKLCNEEGAAFGSCLPCDGSGDTGEGSGGSDGLGAGHGTDSRPPPPSTDRQPPSSTTEATPPASPDGEPPLEAGAPTTTADAGSPSTTRDAGGAAGDGPGPAAPGGTTPSAAHCKPLKNIAPRIELQKIADEPRPAKGGKPVSGVYVQSWVVQFTGEDGETGPSKHYSTETLEVTGTTGRYVFEDDDGTKAAGGFRLTAQGTKVSIAYECPAAETKELAYDATESTLIIYDPPYARVFTRQQGAK